MKQVGKCSLGQARKGNSASECPVTCCPLGRFNGISSHKQFFPRIKIIHILQRGQKPTLLKADSVAN